MECILNQNNHPEFSVLSVTYNGEKEERLEKFFISILNQTLLPNQIVLCIDGTIRQSLREIINFYTSKLNLKVINNTKQGLANNLNIGLQHISTKYTIRCDTDDVSVSNRFEKQISILETINVSVTSGYTAEVGSSFSRVKKVPIGYVNRTSLLRFLINPVNHNCCAFNTEDIKTYYYTKTRMEDFILWSKLINRGFKIFNTSEVLVIADVTDLLNRRQGKDYRQAEIKLLQTNLKGNLFFLWPVIFLPFLIRFVMRYKFMSNILSIIHHMLRRKS